MNFLYCFQFTLVIWQILFLLFMLSTLNLKTLSGLASHFDELIWRVWDAMITNIFLLGRNMLPCIKSKYHTASMLWIYTKILNGNHTQDCVTKYGTWFNNAHILVVKRKHFQKDFTGTLLNLLRRFFLESTYWTPRLGLRFVWKGRSYWDFLFFI